MRLKFSFVLSLYFLRVFLLWFCILFSVFTALAILVESAELLRRSTTKTDISLDLIVKMSLLKIPFLLQKLLPLFVLFAAFLGFRRLQKNSEVIVARSSGFSLIQLFAPLAVFMVMAGLLEVMVISPWVSYAQEKFEKLESRFLRRSESQFMVSDTGLWLKQPEPNGYTIVHVKKIYLPNRSFQEVSLYFFQDNSVYLGRLDASSAMVKKGYWELIDPSYFSVDRDFQPETPLKFRTFFTPEKVEGFFAPAATLSFWQIPYYIQMIEKAGFPAINYRIYWHGLLALPLALLGMFLIGSTLSLYHQRGSKALWRFGVCFFVGFLFYIFQDITQILSRSFLIPVELGLWGPPLILSFLAVSYVIFQEH